MYHFATYFDKNYLAKGLLLFDSLFAHANDFRIYVLCLDDETYHFLERYDTRVVAVRLSTLEALVPELLTAKTNRSTIEYYFTVTSVWCHHLISTKKEIDILSYLDADLFFFNDLSSIYEELGDKSVLIIPHNFSPKNQSNYKYGIYNVGFICWKNNHEGLDCLAQWKNDCLDWCYDRLEEGKFADQKYLDAWPEQFDTQISMNKGLNAAYYNIGHQDITKQKNEIYIDGDKLIFFHFHSIKQLNKNHYLVTLLDEEGYANPLIIKGVYLPYLKLLNKVNTRIGAENKSIRFKDSDNISVNKYMQHLIFDHNIIVLNNLGWYINLERRMVFVLKIYRGLKKLWNKINTK